MDQLVHNKDLRDRLDLNENSVELKRTLQMYLPPGATNKTRGIDCMIALIKCIYSRMTTKHWERNAENNDREKKNPLLALAWLDVDYEHPDSIPEWNQARRQVAALFGLSDSTDGLSFETKLESDLVTDTLWKGAEFVLWRAIMIIERGELKTPNLTFRDCIRKPFQCKLNHGVYYVKMCADPRLIRVDYSTKSGLAALPFSTIKNIKIPIIMPDGSVKECWYSLLAVVSLRQDSIRTYSFMGEQIIHYPESPVVSKDHKEEWSLEEDIDGRFILFYDRVGYEPKTEPNFGFREFARTLHAAKPIVSVETLKGEMERGENLKESVKALWKQYLGENGITGPVVAPFTLKLETFIPDMMVRETDLAKLNELLWCCKVVYRPDERLLSVLFTGGNGPGSQRSRVEFLKTWSVIKSWLSKVYAMSPILLYEYFQYVQMMGIEGHPEGPDELLVNKARMDGNYGAAQETIARSLELRDLFCLDVQNLITSDANETERALSQWILSRPADERLICARIAAWD